MESYDLNPDSLASELTCFDASPHQLLRRLSTHWYQVSSLSLAGRRLKPPAFWKRQHGEADSELMTQTTHSPVLFIFSQSYFISPFLVSPRSGRQCPLNPVHPGIFDNIHFSYVTIKDLLSPSEVPEFGDTFDDCSMQKAYEMLRQVRGADHRQDCWHLL